MKYKPPFTSSFELYKPYVDEVWFKKNTVIDANQNVVASTGSRAMAKRIANALNKVEPKKK